MKMRVTLDVVMEESCDLVEDLKALDSALMSLDKMADHEVLKAEVVAP